MLEKDTAKQTYLPAVVTLLLLLAASVVAGNTALAAIPADEVVIVEDTIFGDKYPDFVHVQDAIKNGSGVPAVPMVEIDTNVYEKRLWLSEKKKISHPDKSKDAFVIAVDSIVFVAYWSWSNLMATYSTDFGQSWGFPTIVKECGDGHSLWSPEVLGQTIILPYSSSFGEPITDVLISRIPINDFSYDDSILVHRSSESWEYSLVPRLAQTQDTLFVLYKYYYFGDRYVRLRMSLDSGKTWSDKGSWVGPGTGTPTSLLITDSVMSFAYNPGDEVEVRYYRSLDRGETWEGSDSISMSYPPSQRPYASTDGISIIHTAWYDFEDLPLDATGGWVYYRRSLNAGESWEDIRCLSTKASSEVVAIWTDTNYTYACWNDARYGSPNLALYLRYSHDDGSTWSEEIQIVDEADPAWDPDIYAQGDMVHIVWQEQHPPDWIWEIQYIQGAWYIPGDVDLSEGVDISDLVYMVDWMFNGGPAPLAYDAAQMDGVGTVDISDLVYIVDYMFDNGPPPVGGVGL